MPLNYHGASASSPSMSPGALASVGSVDKQSEIAREVSHANMQADELCQVVAELERRLSPILRLEPENDTPKEVSPVLHTAVGRSVADVSDKVSAAGKTMSSILRRLEV